MIIDNPDSVLTAALIREQYALQQFRRLFQLTDLNCDEIVLTDEKQYLTEQWTVKDYLSDIVFWHESFARNIADVGSSVKPNLIKLSLRAATAYGVESNKNETVSQLLRRLNKAQRIIEAHIFNQSILTVPYRQGSRLYTKTEYLDIRTSELNWHFWAIIRSALQK